jgi:hypothetical protein
VGPCSTDRELRSSVNEHMPMSFVNVGVGRREKFVKSNSWASKLIVAKSHIRYCGLFHGPRMEQ